MKSGKGRKDDWQGIGMKMGKGRGGKGERDRNEMAK